jgi:hypothetical protein
MGIQPDGPEAACACAAFEFLAHARGGPGAAV